MPSFQSIALYFINKVIPKQTLMPVKLLYCFGLFCFFPQAKEMHILPGYHKNTYAT